MSTHPNKTALAYSYVRFSSPAQALGDSLRRQTEAAATWCKARGVVLDTSTTLHDLGKSAFLGEHRKNPDRNALAAFLKLVEQGKVPRGSFLLLESLDRLSREHIRPALTLLLQLIESGVRVVQLIPVEAIYDDKVEPMQLMMAIMELSRGHSESAVKSERVGAAWRDKKERAKRKEHILTHQLPSWVREVNGKLELIPERAAAVRRVFELARSGYGQKAIVNRLAADGVAHIGRGKEWSRSYVAKILYTRQALGEFQLRNGDGTEDGPPILNYFPAVVTEEEWLAAKAEAAGRRNPGRKKGLANGSLNNLFAGMLTDARDGGSYTAAQRVDGVRPGRRGGTQWALINTRSAEGLVPCVSFPLAAFEEAVLSKLREINPRELLDAAGPIRSATLAADLAREDEVIARLEAELEKGEEIAAVVRVLAKKEARRKELADALASARAEEATPVSAAWGEFGTLWDVLAGAADRDHVRRKLRSVLCRMVERVWLLAVPKGRTRVAAVRVQFAGCGDRHRDYLIVYKPPKANAKSRTPASLAALSFASAGLPGLDLRKSEHATRLEKVLETMEL